MNTDFRRATRRMLMLGTGACALTLGSAAALAQDAPSADLEAPADEEVQDDQPVIIVTGQKIERSLQDTQASVSVVDETLILERNFQDIDDVLNQTANVASLFDGSSFSIRGLQNSGAGAGSSSDVAAIFIDGVFIPSRLLGSGAFSLWDVGSVEIFRGPQSTIQGRNSLAGAVIINTVNPGDDFEVSYQAEAAEFNSYRASAGVTVPIAPGQVSLRLAGDYLTSDGFVENTFLNIDDADESESITARATLLVTPDFATDFEARFGFTYTNNDVGGNRSSEAIFRATEERVSTLNLPPRREAEAYIASAQFSYDFSPEFSITAITGFIDSSDQNQFDPDNSNPIDAAVSLPPGFEEVPTFNQGSNQVITQELRLSYDSDDVSVLFGGYFFDSTGDASNDNTFAVATDAVFPDPQTLAFLLGVDIPTASFLRGQVVAGAPGFPVQLIGASTTDQRNYALFGEATWDISDKLSITLGARYDNERVDQTIVNGTLVPEVPVVGDPTIDALIGQVVDQFDNVFTFEADTTFEAFLPKAAIVYNFTDDVSLGFTYQRAYRAGGLAFNNFRANLAPPGSDQSFLEETGAVNRFDPEFTNNYELSFRSVWGDGDFVLNANAYIIDYTDQLINVQLSTNPLDNIVDNAGSSRLTGFEIEATMFPTDGLSLFANVGYADTIFTDGAGTLGNDITDFEFASTPDITVGFGGRYEHDSGFYVNLQNRLTGGALSSINDANDITNEARAQANDLAIANGDPAPFTEFLPRLQDPSGNNDPIFTVDLNVGYEADRFTIEVFARNLFAENGLTFDPINDPIFPIGANGQPDPTQPLSGFQPGNNTVAIINQPQQFGIRITGNF
ncbi:MAG: TonB-dependent receptor [Pseudomonadota bacterium]